MSAHFKFGKFDKITLRNSEVIFKERTPAGYVFVAADNPDNQIPVSHEVFADLLLSHKFQMEPGYYTQARALARTRAQGKKLSDLTKTAREKINRRVMITERLLLWEDEGLLKRTEESLASFRPVLVKLEAKWAIAESDAGGKQSHCDQQQPKLLKLPTSGVKLGWMRKYERCNHDPMCFAKGRRTATPAAKMYSAFGEALLHAGIQDYLSLTKPSKTSVAKTTRSLFVKENLARKAKSDELGRPVEMLWVPSIRTITRAIDDLEPSMVYLARYGEKAALNKFGSTRGGMNVRWPLERVELDEAMINVISLAVRSKVWDLLTDAEKEKIERVRRWVVVAIDVATRAIVGLTITKAPNTEAALEVLEMITHDRTELAASAGAKYSWDFHGAFQSVAVDNGSAFISARFREAITEANATVHYLPAGKPKLRGHIERFFRTMDTVLMPHMRGWTGSSPKERGEYDSEANASISDDLLHDLLIPYVVDAYNQTPHSALGWRSPAQVWAEKVADPECNLGVMDAQTRCRAFGIDVKCKVTSKGIRLNQLTYTNTAVVKAHLGGIKKHILVRVNARNMGEIYAHIGGLWQAVPALNQEAHGVSFVDWKHRCEVKRGIENALRDAGEIREVEALDRIKLKLEAHGAQAKSHQKRPTAEDMTQFTKQIMIGQDPVDPNDETEIVRADPLAGALKSRQDQKLVVPQLTSAIPAESDATNDLESPRHEGSPPRKPAKLKTVISTNVEFD